MVCTYAAASYEEEERIVYLDSGLSLLYSKSPPDYGFSQVGLTGSQPIVTLAPDAWLG